MSEQPMSMAQELRMREFVRGYYTLARSLGRPPTAAELAEPLTISEQAAGVLLDRASKVASTPVDPAFAAALAELPAPAMPGLPSPTEGELLKGVDVAALEAEALRKVEE